MCHSDWWTCQALRLSWVNQGIIKPSSRSSTAWTGCASRYNVINFLFKEMQHNWRRAWGEHWSLESTNRDCWETWASTRQVITKEGSEMKVHLGGPGPAADPVWPEGRCEDERAYEARSPISSELLSFKPKQSGPWSNCSWVSLWKLLGASSQTPWAVPEPRPAPCKDHVCNLSGVKPTHNVPPCKCYIK